MAQPRSPFLDAEMLSPDSAPGPGREAEAAARRSPYADPAVPAGASAEEAAAPFEHALPPPKRPARLGEVPLRPHVRVVGADSLPLTGGEYEFAQDGRSERGPLRSGLAFLGSIDPSRPFLFAVRDRVCLIRRGAFLNPDDPTIEYGGTSFDWALVRDDRQPDRTFWPHYQQAMDRALRAPPAAGAQGRRLDQFAQHEHITRRPIQIVPALRARPGDVRICAVPAQLRVGPFVRFTDHERAVIWLESLTPCMVRVGFRQAGAAAVSWRYAATVRVGGRHFAAVELDDLAEGRFYDYTVALAPLPLTGPIPVEQADLRKAFPELTTTVGKAMSQQCAAASLKGTGWLAFRTLLKRYDKRLRFATGSCRWFPGDQTREMSREDLGPDMLEGLGKWLLATPKEGWPQFLFFGGDQIYADEIGADHARMITQARVAARVPGPAASAASPRDQLADGAWAGRFAHRYRAYRAPAAARLNAIRRGVNELDDIYKRYPDILAIATEYPDADPEAALRSRYITLRNRRQLNGQKGEDNDERKAREALALLPRVKRLATDAEPYRPFLPYWQTAAALPAGSARFLSHNFLLWSIPHFEEELPTLTAANLAAGVRTPDKRGHPCTGNHHMAGYAYHAADFAEYAYLYERAWTSSREVRVALAHVPTFLMFDDHEATDDWNFSEAWVRMLHNPKDELQMWPKTLTDSLAAYWVYQGWCNKAPPPAQGARPASRPDPQAAARRRRLQQWSPDDPRVAAMADAQRQGTDALPALRKCIHAACFAPPGASYKAGMGLDWHYQLPFDPPFLVPDCRSRRQLRAADDALKVIVQDDPAQKAPQSQTIDDVQLAWMRDMLVRPASVPVAFIAPSTPLLLQKKLMELMLMPEVAARLWAGDTGLLRLLGAVLGSRRLGGGSASLLTLFRRNTDLEHMVRDKSWRDLWGIVATMRRKNSGVKTLVLVSGDVHHSYCMTANLPGAGRPQPEVLQITSSGLQTTIRLDLKTTIAGTLSSNNFKAAGIQIAPGYMLKNTARAPHLWLYQNAVALVDVVMEGEVAVNVIYLSGKDRYVYRYTSGPAYTAGAAPGAPGAGHVR